jgi:NADPH2:quinone reductase
MKAWRIHEHGPFREKLKLEDIPEPKPSGSDCVVRVQGTALNFPDLLAIAGTYQMKPDLPFVPGMELAGEVIDVGPDCPFRKGERVMSMGLGAASLSKRWCRRRPATACPRECRPRTRLRSR